MPPYETYILYEVYIIPGLIGMILLFNGMQSSLSMVYDREMGSMRMLLVEPDAALVPAAPASCWPGPGRVDLPGLRVPRRSPGFGIAPPPLGYLTVLPALIAGRPHAGRVGLLLSSMIRQLENFAGVMNFVIFPMFFVSSALYPLWRMQESSAAPLPDLRRQPVHPRRRADPLRALRARRAGGARLDAC